MTEISFKTKVFFTGNIKKDRLGILSVSDFDVWVELDGSDIDVTNTLTVDQLKSLKLDFLSRYEIQLDELQALEEREAAEDMIEFRMAGGMLP